MNLRQLLERFVVDFGSKLEGKLGPSWHENLKNGCPHSQEAIKFLAKTISRGTIVHGILKAFMSFLEKTNHHQSASTEPA